jgi:hypothetical protein
MEATNELVLQKVRGDKELEAAMADGAGWLILA